MARVVVPGFPHHVTQRGNRRQRTFFSESDYRVYRTLLAQSCAADGTEVWAYCLMPNHVHLVMVPSTEDGLRSALGEAHRRYTRRVNFREGWRGHLWQERFHSFPMDERHLQAAVRYVELNPVAGGLCARAELWPWSSAGAHLHGRDDDLVRVQPMLDRIGDWRAYLTGNADPD
jgi:putative transposase